MARSTVSDPAQLYDGDLLVELDADKALNNGSPALHAMMLCRLGVQPGDHVLHVGIGGGYYTALLAELTGPGGKVVAVEYDARLAGMARENLKPWPWVRVVHGDGAGFPTEPTQRIYVNFALADPADAWLDHLTVGGRLVFPAGVPDPRSRPRRSAQAAVLVVTRTASGYAAHFRGKVGFIFAEGSTAGDPATRAALGTAFSRGGLDRVTNLRRGPAPPEIAWFSSRRWSLCIDP